MLGIIILANSVVGEKSKVASRALLKSLLMSQVFALIFSLVAAFAPQYFWLLVIAFMLIIPFTMGFGALKARATGKYKEIVSARRLFKEDNAMDLAMRDPRLSSELGQQMKMLLYSLVTLPLFIVVSIGYRNYVLPYFQNSGDILIRFLGFLIMYEIFVGIGRLVQVFMMRKSGFTLMIPQKYIVTEKGVIGKGVTLSFPLKNYKIEADYRRKFVQLIPTKTSGRVKTITRFYTKDVERLKKILEKYALEETGSSESLKEKS